MTKRLEGVQREQIREFLRGAGLNESDIAAVLDWEWKNVSKDGLLAIVAATDDEEGAQGSFPRAGKTHPAGE